MKQTSLLSFLKTSDGKSAEEKFKKEREKSVLYREINLNVELVNDFLPPLLASSLLKELQTYCLNADINPLLKRRQNATFGEDGMSYTVNFHGHGKEGEVKQVTRHAKPWATIPSLLATKNLIKVHTGQEYNYCIVQYYANGKIGMKPHRDKEINPSTIIAGLSLGQERRLGMVSCSPNSEDVGIPLAHNSLYLLRPPTNSQWLHSIIVDNKAFDPRWSVTFRLFVQ
jgi:alkylated DNA repair dioxygenase AlkB